MFEFDISLPQPMKLQLLELKENYTGMLSNNVHLVAPCLLLFPNVQTGNLLPLVLARMAVMAVMPTGGQCLYIL